MKRLAELRGVSQQAVSKRIAGFMARGMAEPRRVGKEKLVHLPTFEAFAATSHDPAQDLRLRHVKSAAPAVSENKSPARADDASKSAYDDASAREKNAKAELAEMRLAEERGDLIRRRDIAPAVEKIATTINQRIATLKTLSGRLYAAAQAGGEEAVAVVMTEESERMLANIRDALLALAADDDESTAREENK